MKMIYTLFIIILSISLYGETSPFSVYGIGDVLPFSSNYTYNSGVDSLSINSKEYSRWSKINNMTLSLSFNTTIHNSFGEFSTGSYDELQISGFNLALPFGEGNVIGASFYPFSIVDYTFFGEESLEENSFGEIYSKTNERYVGGVNGFSMVYVRSYKNLSFSLDFFSRFGNIRRKAETLYRSYDSGVTYSGTKSVISNNQDTFYHAGIGLGSSAHYGEFLGSFSLNIPFYSWGKQYEDKFNGVSDNKDIDVEWPIEFRCSLTHNPYGKLSSNLGFSAILFESVDLGIGTGGQNNFYELDYSINYTHSRKIYDPYLERVSYGLFGLYTLTGVETSESSDISKIKVGLNLGFPYNGGMSKIESQFFVESHGEKSSDKIADIKYGVTLSITGSDNWWLRKKRYND